VGWAKQLPALAEQGVVFMRCAPTLSAMLWCTKVCEKQRSLLNVGVGCRLEWTDTHDQKLYRDQPWDTLTEAVLFIEDARKRGGNVVVHCAQGKSRSTTVVVGMFEIASMFLDVVVY
jgi:protein-tyrosine phosphatase